MLDDAVFFLLTIVCICHTKPMLLSTLLQIFMSGRVGPHAEVIVTIYFFNWFWSSATTTLSYRRRIIRLSMLWEGAFPVDGAMY